MIDAGPTVPNSGSHELLLEQIASSIATHGYLLLHADEIDAALQHGPAGLSERVLLLHLFAKEHGWRAVSRLGCTMALLHAENFSTPADLNRWRATGELPPLTNSSARREA